jgi:hypothetical protein
MTLADITRQKLADSPPRLERSELTVTEVSSGWCLALVLDRHDDLGCLVWEMILHRSSQTAPALTLQAWARQIKEQTTALQDNIEIVEIDLERNEGFLRSAPPSARKGYVLYYEIFLMGTREVRIRRYQTSSPRAEKRRQVAFALTHESLVHLVEDLTGA